MWHTIGIITPPPTPSTWRFWLDVNVTLGSSKIDPLYETHSIKTYLYKPIFKVRFTNSWQTKKIVCPNSSVAFKFHCFDKYQQRKFWAYFFLLFKRNNLNNITKPFKNLRLVTLDLVFDLFRKQKIWRQQTSLDTTFFSVCQEFVNLTLALLIKKIVHIFTWGNQLMMIFTDFYIFLLVGRIREKNC